MLMKVKDTAASSLALYSSRLARISERGERGNKRDERREKDEQVIEGYVHSLPRINSSSYTKSYVSTYSL